MKAREPSWRAQARQAARRYPLNCRELERLQRRDELALPRAAAAKRGRLVRPAQALQQGVENPAQEARLRREIEAVEYALMMAAHKPMGESIRRLFELVYCARSHTLAGAAMQLGCSESTAQRYNDFFLTMTASALGLVAVRDR